MTWGWSHTAEAYANAQRQVESKDRRWLVEVWAEIQAAVPAAEDWQEPEYSDSRFERAKNDAEEISNEGLASAIWEWASEDRTCDNGGFNAHCCPWGCHTVPFDAIGEVPA